MFKEIHTVSFKIARTINLLPYENYANHGQLLSLYYLLDEVICYDSLYLTCFQQMKRQLFIFLTFILMVRKKLQYS